MKKILALLVFLGVLAGFSFAAIVDPVSSVISSDKYLYIPNQSTNQVVIYNASGATVASINVGGSPRGLALSPDQSKLYVSTTANAALKEYNAKTGALNGTFNSGTAPLNAPRGIAVSPDGKLVYLVDDISNKVKVYDAVGRMLFKTIDINVSSLYGIAISPDNSMIAITQRSNSGKVYVYKINFDANNNVSDFTIITSKTDSTLVFPSTVLFSVDGARLFVKTNQKSGSFADVVVYSGNNFSTTATITLVASDDFDVKNPNGEAMAMSSNGEKLYLTHYISSLEGTENKVHLYKISTVTYDDVNNLWIPRTNWTLNYNPQTFTDSNEKSFPVTYDSIMSNNIPPSIDGLAFVPDGSRLWISGSETGYNVYSKWTGYTNSFGVLVNPIPQAPKIIHPAVADDLLNYSGKAEIDASVYPTGSQYVFEYKKIGDATWATLSGVGDSAVNLSSDKFLPGLTYVIRVKAVAAGVVGQYSYSLQFKMAIPTITEIVGVKNDANGNPVEFNVSDADGKPSMHIWDSYKIKGHGFGTRNKAIESVDDAQFNITIGYNNAVVKAASIGSWGDKEISFTVPKNLKKTDGKDTIFPCSSSLVAYITAFSIKSGGKSISVLPAIATLTPTVEYQGGKIDIYGAFTSASSAFGIIPDVYLSDFSSTPVKVSGVKYTYGEQSDSLEFNIPTSIKAGNYIVMVTTEGLATAHYAGHWDKMTIITVNAIPAPVIGHFEVRKKESAQFVAQNTARIFDTVRIFPQDGTSFGPIEGAIKIGDVKLSKDNVQWNWNADPKKEYIEIFVPRSGYSDSFRSEFIDAGRQGISVINSAGSDNQSFVIQPKLDSINPNSGLKGTAELKNIRIGGFGFAPTGNAINVYSDGVLLPGNITCTRGSGDDSVVFDLPNDVAIGVHKIEVKIIVGAGGFMSDNSLDFTVKNASPAGPTITNINPNSAPNTGPVTVTIAGTNFQNGVTVNLINGITDIQGTNVNLVSPTQLTVSLPIASAAVGSWDVKVTNPDAQFFTQKLGFNISGNSGEISQILDNFEGVLVPYPTGYSKFMKDEILQGGEINYAPDTITKSEGTSSFAISYPLTSTGFRGYNAHLAATQDISAFSSITIMVKGDGSTGTLKVQLKDIDGHAFGAPTVPISLFGSAEFVKKTIPLAAFVEIDENGNPIAGGHALNKSGITDYQLVFTGNDQSVGTINVDYLAAGSSSTGTGSLTFNLYHLEVGNENWIANPFAVKPDMDNTVKLGQKIAATYAAGEGDNISIRKWDNATQTFVTTSGDYAEGLWLWEPINGNPIAAGEMFKVSISHAAGAPFNTSLVLSGDIISAGAIQFGLSHLDVGNENWMSIPYNKTDLVNTKLLGQSISTTFAGAEGDNVSIRKWDNETQTFVTTSGDNAGGSWLWEPEAGFSAVNGFPYMVNISRAAGAPFSTTTNF